MQMRIMPTATAERRMNSPCFMFPDALKAILAMSEATRASGLPEVTRYLVHVRVNVAVRQPAGSFKR
jgi:hypothetical protein